MIACPVALQGMLNTVVNLVDTLMIGTMGATAIAAVGLANKFFFVFSLLVFGIVSGSGVLAAQFWGNGDLRSIRKVLGLSILLALTGALFFVVPALVSPQSVMRIFTTSHDSVELGSKYLKIAVLTYPFLAMTNVYVAILRAVNKVIFPVISSCIAIVINICLNYVLIFGKLGLPRLGGIGAGVATGITFWLLLVMFAVVVSKLQPFKQYDVLGFVRPVKHLVAEYLRIGVPMGVAIFMETSIIGVVALFIAKFGTEVIAAHQAALNFSSLIYMFPMSFSLALTIVVGVEYGAKNYQGARDYTALGLEMSLFIAMVYMALELVTREYIALIYTTNPHVIELVKVFIIYAIMWQGGDAVAAPIQGILRGYKDVNATFWCSMLAYWAICLPVGLLLDYKFNNGAFAYWQSLDIGVICSAVVLSLRLILLQRRIKKYEE